MKIAIEAQRICRQKKHGMDFVALNYIIALCKKYPQQQFTVFTKKGANNSVLPEFKNLKLIFIPSAPYPIWEQVLLPIYCLKHSIEILHCTSNTAPLFPLAKLVLTLHDIIFLEQNPLKEGSLYQKFGNLYRKAIVPTNVKTAKKVITVSNYEKENFKQRLPKIIDKTVVVYNAANDHFYEGISRTNVQSAKDKYNLPENFFLFLGNTDPKKNVNNVLKAYYLMWLECKADTPLLLVPDYPSEWLEKWFDKNKVEPKFKEQIKSLGYVDNVDLKYVLNQARAFLYPSKRESFGIPILEGFLSQVPVVTSDAASMPEVAGSAAFLADPLNPADLKDKLKHTLTLSESDRKELIAQGLKRAHEFSWEHSATQLMKIYQAI